MQTRSLLQPRTLRRLALAAVCLLAACSSGPTATDTKHSVEHPADERATDGPEVLSQDQRMQWWREARFGMFIHWGLYAIPAGEWQGNTGYGEWIRDSAHIPVDTYEQFQPRWNPTSFDAEAWAQMAADAGMKYVVITSKHHDGFALFDSNQGDWDVGNTPSGRDIMQELSAACRRHGITFCTYHSIMDWHHPDYLPRRPWEAATRSSEGADFDRFEKYLHAQVTEVIQRYHPAVMWFDGEWESTWTHERGQRLFDLCRALAPEMIVNNRVDVGRGGMAGFSDSRETVGDFATPEQEIPATGLPGVDWESCMTMNSHWGWNAADTQWKSSEELVRNLIDIASKGGNYLLNIGPRADGTFPPNAVERLQQIGAWMRTNGEAIHGTTASVFDALPFGRCTVRANETTSKLYLHVFDWPKDHQLMLPGLANTVTRAYLLAAPDQNLALAVSPASRNVTVMLPATASDAIATVVVVEVTGIPVVYQVPQFAADADEFVTAVEVTVSANNPELQVHYTLDGSEPSSTSTQAIAAVRVEQTCTMRAAAFRQGQRVSDVVDRTFTRVSPLPAASARPNSAGLTCERLAVGWQQIPDDYASVAARSTFVANEVGFAKNPGEHLALRFRGFVDVPDTELYQWALSSDDGSKLWVDGKLVVDNDGLHGPLEKRGAIALAKGLHTIQVAWFNATGDASLRLKWATPGHQFVTVPGEALWH